MKRIYRLTMVLLLAGTLFFSCGSSGGDDATAIIKQQADVTEDYINGLEAASDADSVVKVIEKYTQGMKDLIPKLQEFYKNHPDFQQGKVPEGLEKETERLNEIAAKLPGAMMKTASYMMDPKVQKAMQDMGNEMAKIQQ